jgi:hypothetical protein
LSHIRSAAAAITSIVTASCITASTSGASPIESAATGGTFATVAALAADKDGKLFTRCNRDFRFNHPAVADDILICAAAGAICGNRDGAYVFRHDKGLPATSKTKGFRVLSVIRHLRHGARRADRRLRSAARREHCRSRADA